MSADDTFLTGAGEMGALVRATDWSRTALGPIAQWPQSLRTAMSICLNSRFPIALYWGPEFLMLYNESLAPMIGAAKHPAALGRPALVVLAEIRALIEPLLTHVRATGEATFSEDLMLPLARNGAPEEGYFTFTYSPIRDETGGVGGVFCAAVETTEKVIEGRRLRLFNALAHAARAASPAEACAHVAAEIASAPHDVPFALVYLRDEGTGVATLAGTAHLDAGTPLAPRTLRPGDGGPWSPPLDDACEAARVVPLVAGPHGTRAAMVLPLSHSGGGRRYGVLVVGLSPLLSSSDSYARFHTLLAASVAHAVSSAVDHAEERSRLDALAALDRAKTTFFSNVSHEFRTPLTLMLGPTEDALASPERALAGDDLERVYRNELRLLKLVNVLLEFSRIESGRAAARFQPTDLAALTTGLANAFHSVVTSAGLAFVVECPPLPEPIYVDPELWEKIVLNLVSNAFKFTLSGGIFVRLAWRGDAVELSVEDTGTGIPADDLPRVFQRFHRVEGAQGRSHEGSGIGLSLVQELTALHAGSVAVRSTVGVGSTFTVVIPTGASHVPAAARAAAAPLDPRPDGRAVFVREAAAWLPSSDARDKARPAAPGATRVLLADDNADMRAYVRRVLESHFAVHDVADGQAALDAARAAPPDVVLADVMMPRLDGLALTRALRADPRTRHVPIVLLSARAGESATVEGLEVGADDYLVKPFGARELVARVQGAVKVARADVARRHALERVAGVLDAMGDGFFAVDAAWRITAVNPSFERMTHARPEDVLGTLLWDAFPATRDPARAFWQNYQRCMTSRQPVHFVDYHGPLARWTDVRANPTSDGGIAVFVRDVTNERRAADLRARQVEFEQQLIGIVSHDLRNPLNVVLGSAAMLLRSDELPDRATRAAVRIHRAADRAARIVADLLDFTQARLGGGLRVAPRPVELASVVRTVLDEVEAAYPERRIEATHEGDGHGLWDPDRLAQVVQNLVTNALKYSPGDSAVHVQTRVTPSEAVLVVRNAGAPIATSLLPALFEPFQRASVPGEPADRSIGLGLYIVKQVVDAHHGSIDVRSSEGAGTTFTVRIPCAPPDADRASAGVG